MPVVAMTWVTVGEPARLRTQKILFDWLSATKRTSCPPSTPCAQTMLLGAAIPAALVLATRVAIDVRAGLTFRMRVLPVSAR
ncbi:hypothetical protein D3C87_1955300 [compost metagenome]